MCVIAVVCALFINVVDCASLPVGKTGIIQVSVSDEMCLSI